MDLSYSDIEGILQTGIIAIDTEGYIQLYNDYALDLIGIRSYFSCEHAGGQIQNGDTVMIALTDFGQEDGGLVIEDLKKIGIHTPSIPEGISLLAVGKYGDKQFRGQLALQAKDAQDDLFKLETLIDGVPVHLSVDHFHNQISISYNGISFATDYNNHFGHMVLVDSRFKRIKFYQDHGYTARREDIKSILNGYTYEAKKIGKNEKDIIGKHILEIHTATEAIHDFIKCAQGQAVNVSSIPSELNGISVLCSIGAFYRSNCQVGAIMAFQDMTMFKNIKKQKDLVTQKLQRATVELNDRMIIESMFPNIMGKSAGIAEVKRLAYKASKTNSNVLILGESGTGKSILARSIHEAGGDPKKPFIHVNCNAIPETLLESELFGYEKGAFTGANKQGKNGFFEIADNGTLFLDEIGDMSINMQVKLLQVIQDKSFYRVGGNKKIEVNVRIIAATNQLLEEHVKNGKFREDLYYRINVFPIYIPPLKERYDDIRELVNYLLPKINKRMGGPEKRISAEGIAKIMSYQWPGNIRELENVLERAISLAEDNIILSSDIQIKNSSSQQFKDFNFLKPLKEAVQDAERDIIAQVLDYTNGNKKEAMDILKLKKSSFYEKLKHYDL